MKFLTWIRSVRGARGCSRLPRALVHLRNALRLHAPVVHVRTHSLVQPASPLNGLQYYLEAGDGNETFIAFLLNQTIFYYLSVSGLYATNQVNNQRHKYHPLTKQYHFGSEDDYRSGCRNVSHCHQQFFSELHSPSRSLYTNC